MALQSHAEVIGPHLHPGLPGKVLEVDPDRETAGAVF
jgi:hypothetical protein